MLLTGKQRKTKHGINNPFGTNIRKVQNECALSLFVVEEGFD